MDSSGTAPTGNAENIGDSLQFLHTLFQPGDIATSRPVETWNEDNRKRSRVDFAGMRYLTTGDPDVETSIIQAIANRAAQELTNTFVGVNPRVGGDGKYEKAWQIRTVRALWSDLDHVAVEEALQRVESAGLPRPSLVVNSGNGVHLYWVLSAPYVIDDAGLPPAVESEWIEIQERLRRIEYFIDAAGDRVNLHDPLTGSPLKRNEPELTPKALWVQDALQGIAAAIGGDHTHDLARLLRLPGTLNRKNQRNGAEPKPCRITEVSGARYDVEQFGKFALQSPGRLQRAKLQSAPLPNKKRMTGNRLDQLQKLIWACANAPVGDRSGCDFRLCCWAIEHGLTSPEVWPQVSSIGKFAERGEAYFLQTWANAERQIRTEIIRAADPCAGVASGCDDESDSGSSADDDPRVQIEITNREFEINSRVVDALAAEASLFQRCGVLVTVLYGSFPDDPVQRPREAPRIALLERATVREFIAKHVNFYVEKQTAEGTVLQPQHVPAWCCSAVFSRGEWPGIRRLRGLINHPIIKPDGSALTTPGYDELTGLILDWPGEPLAIATDPTFDDAIAAVGRLKSLVADFPFETPAHRSGWLAYVLTLLIRHSFPHAITAPLFLLDASVRGSGKTLLAELGSIIVCGFELPRTVLPADDNEFRKRMLAIALAGDEIILIDNVNTQLGGQTLDAVLTGTVFKDRILGISKNASIEMNTTFVATANNASITGDLCRRTIHIRLASPLENPEERQDFQIPNIMQHVRHHRVELLVDALTILRAYCVAGRPDQRLSAMGSFDDWSTMVRAPLVWCGEPDPWDTRLDFTIRADTGKQAVADILRNWVLIDPQGQGLTAAELRRLLEVDPVSHSELHNAICELCHAKLGTLPSSQTIGRRLGSIRDRVYQEQRLVSAPNRKDVMVWRVESAPDSVPGMPGVAGMDLESPHGQKNKTSAESESGGSFNTANDSQPSEKDRQPPASPADATVAGTDGDHESRPLEKSRVRRVAEARLSEKKDPS